jgi:hypothetical protein
MQELLDAEINPDDSRPRAESSVTDKTDPDRNEQQNALEPVEILSPNA